MVYESVKIRMFRASGAINWDGDQLRDLYFRNRRAALRQAIALTEEAFAGPNPPALECGYAIRRNRLICLRDSGRPRDERLTAAYVAQFCLEDLCGMGIVPVPGVKYGLGDPRSRTRKEVA